MRCSGWLWGKRGWVPFYCLHFELLGPHAGRAYIRMASPNRVNSLSGTGYFGIYDGHGGRNVAEFLRLHLHVNIEKELRLKGDRSVEECLKSAFLITDAEAATTGEQASGSTAVVCLVRRQDSKRYVFTANCGDARAVLCHAGVAIRLSLDHKATDPLEKSRIEAAGGFILRKRVMGVLAVARSFGDFILKKYVTAEPYTSTTKLDIMVSNGAARVRARVLYVTLLLRCNTWYTVAAASVWNFEANSHVVTSAPPLRRRLPSHTLLSWLATASGT